MESVPAGPPLRRDRAGGPAYIASPVVIKQPGLVSVHQKDAIKG
jgi:hypothetical protein